MQRPADLRPPLLLQRGPDATGMVVGASSNSPHRQLTPSRRLPAPGSSAAILPLPQQHHLSSRLHPFITFLLSLLHYTNRFSLRAELDDYLSIVLDMALHFGGTGFYSYHVHFANQATGWIQQFNQGIYWGILNSKLYCRIFAARTSLSLVRMPGAPAPTIQQQLQTNQYNTSTHPL
eukprot:superscaffoldBa00005897_g20915